MQKYYLFSKLVTFSHYLLLFNTYFTKNGRKQAFFPCDFVLINLCLQTCDRTAILKILIF